MHFDLAQLSKYRTQLMGIAMIWVVFFHSEITSGFIAINYIKFFGYGGVDIFLMLSGIGVFFSIKGNESTKQFYKRRFLRILPYYIPVVLLFSLYKVVFQEQTSLSIIYNITTLSFWLGKDITGFDAFDWYVPSLLFFYAVTPPYIKWFKRNPYCSTLIISIIGILISLLITDNRFSYLLIFTIRIPVYFIGILLGYLISKKIVLKKRDIWVCVFLLIIGIIVFFISRRAFSYDNFWIYGLWWYPFILITFPLLMILSSGLTVFKNYSYPVLTFFGKYSLVIYLLHERLLLIAKDYPFTQSVIILNVTVIIITLILGYFYQDTLSKLLDKYR